MQKFEEVQETPVSDGPECGGLGIFVIDQTVPFQSSPNALEPACPTATHSAEDTHETPLSWLRFFGLEVVSRDHPVPFHPSASVAVPLVVS